MEGFRTLPQLAAERSLNLDELRRVMRAKPDLKRIGTKIGPTPIYSPTEADALEGALREYQARRAPVPAGA